MVSKGTIPLLGTIRRTSLGKEDTLSIYTGLYPTIAILISTTGIREDETTINLIDVNTRSIILESTPESPVNPDRQDPQVFTVFVQEARWRKEQL